MENKRQRQTLEQCFAVLNEWFDSLAPDDSEMQIILLEKINELLKKINKTV